MTMLIRHDDLGRMLHTNVDILRIALGGFRGAVRVDGLHLALPVPTPELGFDGVADMNGLAFLRLDLSGHGSELARL